MWFNVVLLNAIKCFVYLLKIVILVVYIKLIVWGNNEIINFYYKRNIYDSNDVDYDIYINRLCSYNKGSDY